MNLGQAVAVCLYELGGALAPKALSTARRKAGGKKRALRMTSHGSQKKEGAEASSRPRSTGGTRAGEGVPARMDTVERIGEAWLRALEKSGYVAPRGKATAEEKLRRMLRRFALQEGDAEVFLGMVKKVLWKLEEGKK